MKILLIGTGGCLPRSSATDKLNRRLIPVSQYLSQFVLDIRHRPGKSNLVADGLSRLPSTQTPEPDSNVLDEVIDACADEVPCFVTCFFEIDLEYMAALERGYHVDPVLARIWKNVDDGKLAA
ncbi:uncharacterized protein N7482_010632 [Penicillium canariense]|uniref:Uncharacterized protein n=1 Tax=Penicillium canariense TaxID=189055 RepID=A0A9W9HM85_9EURO|nr:uncharacterized protein N7482_010632 [Penicillium canariense]KAJ5151380.1 hypothetical protein N7482_010632 [Penicillium canariense]